MTFRILAALLITAVVVSTIPASAQSSGMGVDLPPNGDPQQTDAVPINAAQDCGGAQEILQDTTLPSETTGGSVDAARARFDYLKSTNGAAWLFALQSVDSIYADPELMRRSLADGRWFDLCETRLHGS